MPIRKELRHRRALTGRSGSSVQASAASGVVDRIDAGSDRSVTGVGTTPYIAIGGTTGETRPPGRIYATVGLKQIILAAAHLDHDPTNSSEENLEALCQHCHLAHDRPYHRRRFAVTILARRALGDLFSGPYFAW